MTDVKDALDQYLTLRRSLGYKLQNQERRLRNFVEYARSRGERYITFKLAVDWAGHQCGAPTCFGEPPFDILDLIQTADDAPAISTCCAPIVS